MAKGGNIYLIILDWGSSLVLDCWELAVIFAIKFLAPSRVLSNKAHLSTTSITLLSVGTRLS